MELVIDAREHGLLADAADFCYPVVREGMDIGDLMIRKDGRILLLIERKTVRDLCASLRDGRYANQRTRWREFQDINPDARVALFIEGDLIGCPMDEVMRGSLLNSLFRLQTIHRVIVHHVRDRRSFLVSLELLMHKFEKDENHLIAEPSGTRPSTIDLSAYKKTRNVDAQMIWRSILCLIPGISGGTAEKIMDVFPSLSSFMDDPSPEQKLSGVRTSTRRLGQKQASRVVMLLRPVDVSKSEKDASEEKNNNNECIS